MQTLFSTDPNFPSEKADTRQKICIHNVVAAALMFKHRDFLGSTKILKPN